jgi:hypothetical protein
VILRMTASDCRNTGNLTVRVDVMTAEWRVGRTVRTHGALTARTAKAPG